MEEQVESNNGTVDTLRSKRNQSEDLINKVANLKINDVVNDMIDNVANLKINNVGNNLTDKVANLTINHVRKDSNRATMSDVQVQSTGDLARISHMCTVS